MALKLKKRGNDVLKRLYYGLDGSGKSTRAYEDAIRDGLKPACIDVDDTNFTDVDIIDLDLSNDIKAYKNIKEAIKEIAKDPDYDTIMFDGVSAALELLTPHVEGQRAYKVRADRWSSILQHLINSKKNLIFIGQADMEVIFNDEFQSPKPIIKVNSIVNEKYLCLNEKGVFTTELKKYRGSKDERPVKPKTVPKKQESLADIPQEDKQEANIDDEEITVSQEKELKALPKLRQAIDKLKTDGELVNRENIIGALETQKGNNDTIIQKLTERMDNILRG